MPTVERAAAPGGRANGRGTVPEPRPRLATLALAHLAPNRAEPGAAAEARWLVSLRDVLDDATILWADAVDAWDRAPPRSDRRLHGLCRELELAPVERVAVALALAADVDLVAGRALAWLQAPQGGVRPTAGLLASLEEQRGRGAGETLAALLDGAALASGLLLLEPEGSALPDAGVRLPLPLVAALEGGNGRWTGVVEEVAATLDLAPTVAREADRRGGRLDRALVVRCAEPAEGRAVCARLAAANGMTAAFVDIGRLEAGQLAGVGPWLRVRGSVPVVFGDGTPGERRVLPEIPGYLGPVLVFTGLDGVWEKDGVRIESWTVPVPSVEERVAMWRSGGAAPEDAVRLGRVHRVGAERVARLVAEAHAGRGGGPSAGRPTPAAVARVARRMERGALGALAEPLPEDIDDDALVLPRALREELEALEQRCRVRDGLADELGPAARARYRPGVRALLVGPSGTGKTLACGWLATRLGLPLYRVDLAAVTSKYIGETEKNLGELFARAEHAGVVLMFDEADALFGKRTDVKDAHDRYANQQTNYVLQRIESYDGIVLLTSNSRARFDSAFSRRLDAVLEFPPPQAGERRALWRAHLGPGSAIGTRQLNRLAAGCELAGGHVRNAVLAAKARSPDAPVPWDALVAALAAEYRKLGKTLPAALAGGSGPR